MKEETVTITLKSKDPNFTFVAKKVPLWKAYLILADTEREKSNKRS